MAAPPLASQNTGCPPPHFLLEANLPSRFNVRSKALKGLSSDSVAWAAAADGKSGVPVPSKTRFSKIRTENLWKDCTALEQEAGRLRAWVAANLG